MYFLGYAQDDMMKTKNSGVYCENFPAVDTNYCPEMTGQLYDVCPEYNKHVAKLASYKRKDEKREKIYKQRFGRKPISKETRHNIAMQNKYRCVYCERHISKFKLTGAKGVIDHFIPLQKNGVDEVENYVYACSNCNNAKQHQLWDRGCRKGYYDTVNTR